jgi:ribonuclease P protein component
LTVRLIPKGCHGQGSADVSTQHAPSQAHAWVSGQDGHQKRAPGAKAASREGPQASNCQQRVTLKFRPAERIRRRAEFQQIYSRGFRVHSRYCTAFLLANGGVGRLGIAATKKLGGAVERNRAKRLIREVFRRNKIADGFDVVVIPKRELLDASLDTLEADYRRLIARRVARQGGP